MLTSGPVVSSTLGLSLSRAPYERSTWSGANAAGASSLGQAAAAAGRS